MGYRRFRRPVPVVARRPANSARRSPLILASQMIWIAAVQDSHYVYFTYLLKALWGGQHRRPSIFVSAHSCRWAKENMQCKIGDGIVLFLIVISCAGNKNNNKSQSENMKIWPKRHATIQLMLNRASQEGAFSAQSAKTIISCTTQDGNAPPKVLVLRSFWAWKLRLAHDVGKIRLSKMCLLPWRGTHFHKICKMLKKKRIKKHQQQTRKTNSRN